MLGALKSHDYTIVINANNVPQRSKFFDHILPLYLPIEQKKNTPNLLRVF